MKITQKNLVTINSGSDPIGDYPVCDWGKKPCKVICCDQWDGTICVVTPEGNRWFNPEDLKAVA